MTDRDYFPDIEPYDRTGLLALGYLPFHVSVFDHWLTREEAGACEFMCYEMAVGEEKTETEYKAGEDKFIAFYRRLIGAAEVVVNENEYVYRAHGESLVNAVIVPSLRERRLMDFFSETMNVRVVGGYDRTDLLLPREESDKAALMQMATNAGLCIL